MCLTTTADQSETAKSISFKSKISAIACIIISISSWVGASYVIKDVQTEEEYDKPFFMMYCSTVAYILLFIPWLLIKIYSKLNSNKYETEQLQNTMQSFDKFKILLLPSAILGLINVFVEYFWALSLTETMVSLNTALSQSECAIIYILSIIFLSTKVSFQKIIGVVICLSGVMVIAFAAYTEEMNADDSVTYNSFKGVMECFASALLSSILVIGIDYVDDKYFDENHPTQDLFFLQSIMGLVVLLLYWPIVILFNELDIETFDLPQTSAQWNGFIWTMVLNLAFFGSYFAAIVFTNAVFVAVMLLFALPTAYFTDIVVHGYSSNIWGYAGTVCIIIGFLLTELPMFKLKRKKWETVSGK
eukprot:501439_1